MANGMERVQRLTGEAYQRVRNDHEQFLEAYESEFLWTIKSKLRPSVPVLFTLSWNPRIDHCLRSDFWDTVIEVCSDSVS